MANMSYCRFWNTLRDLRDCEEHIPEKLHNTGYDSEFVQRAKLLELCVRIAAEYGAVDSDGALTGAVRDVQDWELDEEDEE